MAEFVDKLCLFGTEAKIRPIIVGEGKPTAETEGCVGALYFDSNLRVLYLCIAKDVEGTNVWSHLISATYPKNVSVRNNSGETYDFAIEHIPTGVIYQNWTNPVNKIPCGKYRVVYDKSSVELLGPTYIPIYQYNSLETFDIPEYAVFDIFVH